MRIAEHDMVAPGFGEAILLLREECWTLCIFRCCARVEREVKFLREGVEKSLWCRPFLTATAVEAFVCIAIGKVCPLKETQLLLEKPCVTGSYVLL
jgi:hypothetical protein